MTLSGAYLETKAKIAAHLSRLGWSISGGGPIAFGTKTYQTAVGEKEAIAYLVPSGGDSAYFQATYISEGNNVLSTIRTGWKPIIFTEPDSELAELAAAFSLEVDTEVSKTYAMRLRANRAL